MEAGDNTASTTAAGNGATTPSPVAASAHPEYPVIGAFVGGFILAKLLKAIGGGGDDE